MAQGTERRAVVNPLEDPQAIRERLPQVAPSTIAPIRVLGTDREIQQLDRVFGGISETLGQWRDDLNNQATLAGEMMQQTGASIEDAAATGNRHTVAGFKSMRRESGANQWFQKQLGNIADAHHQLTPEEYTEELHKSYRNMQSDLGDDSAGKLALHQMSKKFFPKLLQKQVEAHTEWSAKENITEYSNLLITTASTGDVQRLSEVLASNPGLSSNRYRSAVTDALTASLENDDPTLMNMVDEAGLLSKLGFTTDDQRKILKAHRAFEGRQQESYDSEVQYAITDAKLKLQQGGSFQDYERSILQLAEMKDKPQKWVQMNMNWATNQHLSNAKKAMSDAESAAKEQMAERLMSPEFQSGVSAILGAQIGGEISAEQAHEALFQISDAAGIQHKAMKGYVNSVWRTQGSMLKERMREGKQEFEKQQKLEAKKEAGRVASRNRTGKSLKDPVSKQAFWEEREKEVAAAVIQDDDIAPEQKQWAARKMMIQRSLNEGMVPPHVQAAAKVFDFIGKPGEPEGLDEQAINAYRTMNYVEEVAGSTGMALAFSEEQRLTHAALKRSEIHDNVPGSEAIKIIRSTVQRMDERAKAGRIPKEARELIAQAMDSADIMGNSGLSFLTNSAVYERNIKNDAAMQNAVREELSALQVRYRGAEDADLHAMAVENVQLDGSFILGNYISKNGMQDFHRQTFGSEAITSDKEVHDALTGYLADIGPETWKHNWGKFDITSPFDSFKAILATDLGKIPPVWAEVNPVSGTITVDVYTDGDYTELSGRPITIDLKEIGRHYEENLTPPSEVEQFFSL